MRRILFVLSTLRRTGPTRQLMNLCRYLPQFGYLPAVLTLSPEMEDSLAPAFQEAGVETLSLGLSRLSGAMRGIARTKEVIDHLRPAVVHTSGIRGDMVGVRLASFFSHVMTLRNYPWDDYPSAYGSIIGHLMAQKHAALIRAAECPVACSVSTAMRLRAIRQDVLVVQNGVDTTAFHPVEPDERSKLRRYHRLPLDRVLAVSVGSLSPRKAPDVLLRAFIDGGFGDRVTLMLLGAGPLKKKLERQAMGHPSVIFGGNVSNVAEYLRCADVFVSTSRAEGLPNSVLEALASGLPVLLSDIEPHRELGVEESESGRLARLGDHVHISSQLQGLLDAELWRLSRNARSLAMGRFSAATMAENYAAIYERLTAAHKAGRQSKRRFRELLTPSRQKTEESDGMYKMESL